MNEKPKYMDEAHRLKPLSEDFNKSLFNTIYNETKSLRHKLAYEIDSRKFGVDYHEVLSWFDIKMLFAFSKYQDNPKVKGYVINALRTFKAHIIKNSYLPKHQLHNTTDITELYDYKGDDGNEVIFTEEELLLQKAKNYLKSILSEDGYFLLEIELNPPPYILERIKNSEQKKIPKPHAEIIAEYLGISDNRNSIDYIESLRKEIKIAISNAQYYFNQSTTY